MSKLPLFLLVALVINSTQLLAQVEPAAGSWKTWFITSGKEFRLPPPPDQKATKAELQTLLRLQEQIDSATSQKIRYWHAGAPLYRWLEIIRSFYGEEALAVWPLALMALNTAVYDATVAVWDSKYAYNRPRPFTLDSRIAAYVLKPESPSYPCEHAATAGAAATIIAHYFPQKADSIYQLAKEAMQASVAAGMALPSDTKAGFELGKKVAESALDQTKAYIPATKWDGKMPDQPGLWRGKDPLLPLVGTWKPMVLTKGNQLRPGPPPDYQKEMEELKSYKPTFQSTANAFYHASQYFWEECTDKKIFEHNLHLNPPRAARIYALTNIAQYDAVIACFDAKYAYWGIRPDQYDTTFHPVLLSTPPFPGYPSGHAALGAATATVMAYLFPAEKEYFWQKAREGAESRFEGGVHFRTDNEVGLELGKKVAELVVQRAKADGADGAPRLAKKP